MNQYNRDQQIETITSEFLDEYFYSKFNKATITRYSDTYHQFGGIDLTINKTNFDEKVKVYGCLNKVQEYVSFECSIKNKGGYISDGWFLNDSLSTDYYSIIGLSATVSNINDLTSANQITAADVLWVKKTDVADFILENGLSKEQLNLDVIELRNKGNLNETDIFGYSTLDRNGKCRLKYNHQNFWLTYSTQLKEKPVNIIFKRNTLEQLKHSRHFIVTRKEVNKI